MQVLKLIDLHKCKFSLKIGEQISPGGADGELFELVGQPDKVIKLGVIYEYPGYRDPAAVYQSIQQTLDYVMNQRPPAMVHVFEHGYLGAYTRPIENRQQQFVLHYYVMEKLLKINEDEKKIFHTIISHEDRGINKNYSTEKIQELLQGMSRGLDFEADKVILFCDNLRHTQVLHQDIHVRNIMKDTAGHFKLVDFDRATIGEHEGDSK